MAKKTKVKTAAAAVTIPQSRVEMVEYVGQIGEHQRELQRIQATMNDELAEIKARYEAQAETHTRRIDQLTEGVRAWCDVNRSVLTDNDKRKTVVLPTSEVSWRTRPPSVRISGVEDVLDTLRRERLVSFIRVKEEINKDAILASPDAVTHIKGIKITQGEDFSIEPYAAELATETAA